MNQNPVDLMHQISTGQEARNLLDQIQPYFHKVESDLIDQFLNCSIDNEEVVIKTKVMIHCLRLVVDEIENVIYDGSLATHELEGE